ncbi:hypothetical protein KR018_011891 [Drosophila ironensis]|nr:hypothetical protein KR018_011891 [Drosophila ironensis]
MGLTKYQIKNAVFFSFTVVILAVCFAAVWVFSGFKHEPKKFKNLIIAIVIVMLIQFIVLDLIRFAVLAIDHATWPSIDAVYPTNVEVVKFNHFNNLKTRLRGARSELLITERHRNEQLNEQYSRISSELWLYGSYFFVLLLVVLVQLDPQLYYNTRIMERLFHENTSKTIGLSEISFMYEIKPFLIVTMVEGFYRTPGSWWANEANQLMGVVRLRQLRTQNTQIGLGTPVWDTETYLPEWKTPYQRLHYSNKFWRIYDPFTPRIYDYSFLDGLLTNYHHSGALQKYPELGGYLSFLMMTQANSLKVIEYLNVYRWLDRNTCALFIDFNLYNADANAFTIITLRVENSPFGPQITNTDVDSVKMIETLDQKPVVELLVITLYLLLVIHFGRKMVVAIWYDPKSIFEAWNLVDLCICVLNVLMMLLLLLREYESNKVITQITLATRAQYLDFKRPLYLHLFLAIVKGFLVSITTLRLWKVMQFASVFKHFTHTLSSAWQAMASLGLIILIVLTAIGVATSVPNGANAVFFRHLTLSIGTCLWYSMGFNGGVMPHEFFYGGFLLGLLIYLLLVFAVAIVLINVFASVIYDYFETSGRMLKEQEATDHISFLEFARIEYYDYWRWCIGWKLNRKKYRSFGNTVAYNVSQKLDQQMEKRRSREAEKIRTFNRPSMPPSEATLNANYQHSIKRLFHISDVLTIQFEILERRLLGDADGNLPTPPGSDSDPDEMPEMYRKPKVQKHLN